MVHVYRFLKGHDNGLIVFKLERERPAFAIHNDTVYYIRDKYVRSYDINTGADLGLLSVRKFGSPYVPPRTLSFNPAERAVVVTITSDNGLFELTNVPRDATGEVKDSSSEGKRGSGQAAIFVARNRFAVLNKTSQVSRYFHISSFDFKRWISFGSSLKSGTCQTRSLKASSHLHKRMRYFTEELLH